MTGDVGIEREGPSTSAARPKQRWLSMEWIQKSTRHASTASAFWLVDRLGVDHENLTYRHSGRDFRLTDVHGRVLHSILT